MTPTLVRPKPRLEPKCRGRRYTPGRQHCRYGVAPRNFFGAFAEGSATTAPAPQFQSRSTGGVTTGTSMSVAFPSGTADGDFLIIAVGGSRSSTAPTTAMTSNALGQAWTKMCEKFQISGSSGGFVTIWGRILGPGESSGGGGTFSVGAVNTNMSYICERWTGVVSFSSGLTATGSISSGTFTLSANVVTTTVPNSVVLTAAGGRFGSTGNMFHTWGGGATSAYGTASGRIGSINDATELFASPGSTSPHTITVTNGQGAPATCIGSVILSPA